MLRKKELIFHEVLWLRNCAITDSELHALVKFDREVKKEYSVPILITDSGKPPQSKVDHLTVIIGDENDIEMQTGNSTIFVYVFEVCCLVGRG